MKRARLLMVIVEASTEVGVAGLIDDLARAACDVSNSSEDDNASIIIEECYYNLVTDDHLVKGWQPPYGEWCRDPRICEGKGYCPRDPTCGD